MTVPGFHVEEAWDRCGLCLVGAVGAARCLCDHGIVAGRVGMGSPNIVGVVQGSGHRCGQERRMGVRLGMER